MRKNNVFVAKIVNMRLTKIFIAIFAPDERLPSFATLAIMLSVMRTYVLPARIEASRTERTRSPSATGCPSKTCFLKIKKPNPFLWYLGSGLNNPKRNFDLDRFQGVHMAVKNLTNIVKKRSKLPRRRNCTGVMFYVILIVFQSCKLKENMSPRKKVIPLATDGQRIILCVKNILLKSGK